MSERRRPPRFRTRTAFEARIRTLAESLIDDLEAPEIPDGAYDSAVDDLEHELNAAVADRWNEWKRARETSQPLGVLPAAPAAPEGPVY